MQEIMINKIIPISKKNLKKLRLTRYPALTIGTLLRLRQQMVLFLLRKPGDALGAA
jgi:hypothetical protein